MKVVDEVGGGDVKQAIVSEECMRVEGWGGGWIGGVIV